MANEKILLMAEANKLGIANYRRLSIEDLKTAIATAKGGAAKGKGKVPASDEVKAEEAKAAPAKGKTAASNGSVPAKGKGKTTTTAASPAKPTPAKSTGRKTASTRSTAGQGAQAKRSATGGKGKPTSKTASTTRTKGKDSPRDNRSTAQVAKAKTTSTRSRKQAVGRVAIDNKAVNWKLESNVGTSGKRKEVLDALRANKGDKEAVFHLLKRKSTRYYPDKDKHEADRMLVWLIGRVAYDYVFKTGQHEPGERAAYGTSEEAQDVRRREQREAARKEAAKAERAAKRANAQTGAGKGKGTRGR